MPVHVGTVLAVSAPMHPSLLVAALEEEVHAFPVHLPGWRRVITGVGKVQAAAVLAAALHEHRPAQVLVVGTCGGLREQPVGSVLNVAAVGQWDAERVVLPHWGQVTPPGLLRLRGGQGPVLCSGDRVVGDSLRAVVLSTGADAVDMEGYGYAYACGQAGVPLRMLKGVTDGGVGDVLEGWRARVRGVSVSLWGAARPILGV